MQRIYMVQKIDTVFASSELEIDQDSAAAKGSQEI